MEDANSGHVEHSQDPPTDRQAAIRALIAQWRADAETARADRWCNTDDDPIWRSIHQHRAEVMEKHAVELEDLLRALPPEGERSKCVHCGGPNAIVCNRCYGMVAYAQPRQSLPPEGVITPPPLWQHAVNECNEAHAALDRHGAPKTKRVRRVRGPDGDQEVTVGLAARIHELVAALRKGHQDETTKP